MDEQQKPEYKAPQVNELQTNVYKVGTTYLKIRTIVSSVIFIAVDLAFIGFAVYILKSQGAKSWPLLAFALVFTGGTLLAIWQVKRSLFRKHSLQATPDKPFDAIGMAEVKTEQTYDKATVDVGETILAWAGPVTRGDMNGQGHSIGLTETVTGAENTLILTSKQLICITFTQVDFNNISEGNNVLTKFAGLDTIQEAARDERDEVFIMNVGKWPSLIEQLKQHNLKDVIDTHFNFGIPFSNLKNIETKKQFFNAGVYIHLLDGTTLKYTFGMKNPKGVIDEFSAHAKNLNIAVI